METGSVVSSEVAQLPQAVAGVGGWLPSHDLRAFVCEQVQSPIGLEALRLLASSPLRSWSVEELAGALEVPERVMEDALLGLSDAYVLVRTPEGAQLAYRSESSLHELVERSLVAYRDYPLEVVRLLLTHAVGRVRLSIDWLTGKLLKHRR